MKRGKGVLCVLAVILAVAGWTAGTVQAASSEEETCSHEETEVVDAEPATTKSKGYTGDVCCRACGKVLEKGTKIARIKSVTLSRKSYVYNGEKRVPGIKVLDTDGGRVGSSNYKVTCKNNRKVGRATVTIKFRGDYSGTVKRTFRILPKGTSLTSLKPVSKGFTAKWKKQTTQTSGYQIQWATNKSFTKGRKTVTVEGKKTTSQIFTSVKAKKKYYVRIRTYREVDKERFCSSWSKAKSVTTKQRVTVFAGDSIATGLYAGSYNGIGMVDISGKKKVVAYKGLNTMTYQTTPAFGGEPGLDRVISYKPYRVYIMLGINEVEWRSVSSTMKYYREIIEALQEETPATDIVVLSVSPVSKSVASRRKGFKNIGKLNRQLKEMAAEYGITYYDYTSSFKDSSGYLLSKYNGGDGIHWNKAGYRKFADVISAYDKKLEK